MPRRGNVPKREILPDPVYGSVLVMRLVNSVMLDGKKGVAQKVVYAAFDQIGAGDGDANHLQKASISLHPRSGQAIESAVKAGATHAFVSGSGPSVVAFTPTAVIRRAVIEAWKRSACVDRIIAASAPAVPSVSRHGNAIQ